MTMGKRCHAEHAGCSRRMARHLLYDLFRVPQADLHPIVMQHSWSELIPAIPSVVFTVCLMLTIKWVLAVVSMSCSASAGQGDLLCNALVCQSVAVAAATPPYPPAMPSVMSSVCLMLTVSLHTSSHEHVMALCQPSNVFCCSIQ